MILWPDLMGKQTNSREYARYADWGRIELISQSGDTFCEYACSKLLTMFFVYFLCERSPCYRSWEYSGMGGETTSDWNKHNSVDFRNKLIDFVWHLKTVDEHHSRTMVIIRTTFKVGNTIIMMLSLIFECHSSTCHHETWLFRNFSIIKTFK